MKKTCFFSSVLVLLFIASLFAAAATDEQWVKYGNSMYAKNQWDQAITAYQKALEINPANYNAALYCGYACMKKGDNGNAINYLQKANDLTPSPEVEAKIETLKNSGIKFNMPDEKSGIEESTPFRVGIKIGVSSTNISRSDSVSFDSRSGLCSGLTVAYGYGSLLSMQADLLYSQKGCKPKGLGKDDVIMLDYIELPLMLKLSLSPFKKLLTGIYGGMYAAGDIIAKDVYNGVTGDISRDFQFFDYGAVFGLDVSYPIVSGRLFIDLRLDLGMANMAKIPSDINAGLKETDSALTISAGYLF
jgi:tetratricopeptide (TPR) repeat protein